MMVLEQGWYNKTAIEPARTYKLLLYHDMFFSSSSPHAQAMVYRWPLKQSEEEKKKEQSLLASQQVVSPTQESRVNQVTHDLVQWAKDLVGWCVYERCHV